MATLSVLVGTAKGAFIYTSDDSRCNWEIQGPIMPGWKISDLVADTRGKNVTLWAAVNSNFYGATVNRSRDMGKTWEQIEHGPKYPEGSVSTLQETWTVVPGRATEPNTLYCGVAEAGLFQSDDGGDHWSEVTGLTAHATRAEWQPGAGGMCCNSIVAHPTNPNRIWVGISAVGVLRTDDAGKTWQTKNDGLEAAVETKVHKDIGTCVHRLIIDPKNPDRLFQQNHRGVYCSNDGGDTWQRIESGLPNASCFGFPMVIHPHQTDTLFVIPEVSDEYHFVPDGNLTVYRTTDAGATWQPQCNGLPDNAYVGVLRQAMAIDACDATGIYFGTTSGQLFCSTDNGDSWRQLPGTLPRICSINTTRMET